MSHLQQYWKVYLLILLLLGVLLPSLHESFFPSSWLGGIGPKNTPFLTNQQFLQDKTFTTYPYNLPQRDPSLLAISPIAPQDQTNLTFTSSKHPLIDTNQTQQLYLTIASFCEKSSSKSPLQLQNTTYNLYVPQTRPLPVKLDMQTIADTLIPWMQEAMPMFHFHTVNYDRIEVYEDKQKNIQYRYTWFLFDSSYQFSIAFDMDVIKLVDPNAYDPKDLSQHKRISCTSNTPQPKDAYTIGIPSKDQMIPLAMDVIPTGKQVLSTDSISPNEYPKASEIILNSIRMRHSTLALEAQSVPLKKKVDGVSDIQLEFRPLHRDEKQTHTPAYEIGEQRNKWIFPPDSTQGKDWNQYPCTFTQFGTWDEQGIYEPHKDQSKQCPGYISSTERMPQQPYDNPTVGKYPWFGGAYGWLFNLEYWIPSFPFAQSN